MASTDSVVLEGWEAFFGEAACFLRDCERNEDTTDQRKLEYICERLENCIAHIRTLYAQIDEEVADSDDVPYLLKVQTLSAPTQSLRNLP